MICLYYNTATKTYMLGNEGELKEVLRTKAISIIEQFDAESGRLARRICENLNMARLLY